METVAYIDGYMRGLEFLIADDDGRKELNPYYVPGFDGKLKTSDEFRRAAAEFPKLEPSIFEYAKTKAGKLATGVVFHHFPRL